MPKKRSKTSEQLQKASSKAKHSDVSGKTKVGDSKKVSSNTGVKLANSSSTGKVSSAAVAMPKKRSKTSEQLQKFSSKTMNSNVSSKIKAGDLNKAS
jgi:hypothetical protein